MAVQTHGPNLFELSYDDTKIVYALDEGTGAPCLEYSGPMGRHSFRGDAIRTENSARGREVSVTLDGVSHLREITLTVFLPDVVFEDGTEATFRTIGIHATRRRSMLEGPGAELTTEPLEFDGTAKLIEFRAAEAPTLL